MTSNHSHGHGKVLNGTSSTVSTTFNLNSTTIASLELFFSKQEAYNEFLPPLLLISFLILIVIYLLFILPSISEWIVNNCWKQGWRLSKTSNDSESSEKEVVGNRRRSGRSLVGGVESRGKNQFFIETQYIYNKTLLQPIPYTNLTYGQFLICLIYQSLVLVFLLVNEGNPFDNFKRSGFLAAAQLPAVILLSGKNSLAGIVGKGYEKLNYLHRLAGRILILTASIHVISYYRKSHFFVELDNSTIWTGTVALVGLGLILFTSFSLFRKSFYQLFLVSHILGYLLFLIFLPIHAPSTLPYIILTFLIYILDLSLRLFKTKSTFAVLTTLSGGMTKLEIEDIDKGWRGGQHIWLRVCGKEMGNGKRWENHPFTISNIGREGSPLRGQHKLTLLIKSTGDWTRSLNELSVKSNVDSNSRLPNEVKRIKVLVDGPYGGTMYQQFSSHQSILLIAGGSGITFAVSILEELIGLSMASNSSLKGIRTKSITLVWSTKSITSLEWYEDTFRELLEVARESGIVVEIRLNITRPDSLLHHSNSNPDVLILPFRINIPLTISTILDDTIASMVSTSSIPTNFKSESESDKPSGVRGGGIMIGVCGPSSLIKDVRKEVGKVERRRAGRVGGINLHSETFGW